MSCNYAEGLSHYEDKGKLGLPEKFDLPELVDEKVQQLATWINESKHTTLHTGAGISTSAGIPDFRGPKGVWTLEAKGLKPEVNISFDDAEPTFTHMAILTLIRSGKVQYVVTQNIDGLHLRSGLQREKLSELHGNMYTNKCNYCKRQFVRSRAVETVGQKNLGIHCPGNGGRLCRGKLFDTVLDWEDGLPDTDLDLADMNSCAADLSLCLGTTLQIMPSGKLPLYTKKRGGRLIICNLQETKQDKHADLIINSYVDDVMKKLLNVLDLPVLVYNPDNDPVTVTKRKMEELENSLVCKGQISIKGESVVEIFKPLDWTILGKWLKNKELLERIKLKKVIPIKKKNYSAYNFSPNNEKKIRYNVKVEKQEVLLPNYVKSEVNGIESLDYKNQPGDIKGKSSIDMDPVDKKEIQQDFKISPFYKQKVEDNNPKNFNNIINLLDVGNSSY